MCKIYTKIDSWFQKSTEEFGQLQTSTRKSKELKFDGLLLSKKYIASTKTLYTEYLTFNYLCGNSQSNLSLYHFLQHNPSAFFLAQTVHDFYKSNPSSANFWTFCCSG